MSKTAETTIEKSLNRNTWEFSEVEGLTLTFSSSLRRQSGFVHAFTTRLGGSTAPPYDSFNLGGAVGDSKVRSEARANRHRLATSLGLDGNGLFIPGQVHSRNVVVIHEASDDYDLAGVDGLITSRIGAPMLLHFADCVPVIVCDIKNKVAGIFHAGWRGTAQAIVRHGVELMVNELGANPESMVAAVGPAIGSCCYPTGENVIEALRDTIEQKDHLERLDRLVDRQGEQPRPDLKAFNALQLLEAGVGEVDISDSCTSCAPDFFFSHRQSGGVTGRQGAIVCISAD